MTTQSQARHLSRIAALPCALCGAEDQIHVEKWLPVVGWDGYYEVSNDGRVRSVVRTSIKINRKYGGCEVVPVMRSNGYLVVNLTRSGVRVQELIHRIVLLAFVGPCPDGYEACHNNGIRSDCRVENLRWDTRKNNHQDKKLHGTWQAGDKHWMKMHGYHAEDRNRDSHGRFA